MNPSSRLLVAVLAAAIGIAAEPSPIPAAALTVNVVELRSEPWPVQVRADGGIAAWQEAAVASDGGGQRVTALYADIGDTVRAGQVLAELDTATLLAQLAAQEAEVAQADASLTTAAADARRAEDLRGSGTLTAQQTTQYLSAERTATARLAAARAQLEVQRLALAHSRIAAPDDGVVIARGVVLGGVVQAGGELFRIIRQGRLEWRAEVMADDIGRIRIGQRASLEIQGAGPASGVVRAIAPVLSERTRTAIVYIDLPVGSARAGMFASGTIAVGEPALVLTLPAAAVISRDGRSLVFTVAADDRARECRVEVGRRQGDLVEIRGGLAAGTRVVAAGAAFLGDGDRVAVAP